MRQVVARAGWHGILALPLARERQVIGVIVGLDRVGLFADPEVALLRPSPARPWWRSRTRLFNETREALAQQTDRQRPRS